jgi:hypothetical protein
LARLIWREKEKKREREREREREIPWLSTFFAWVAMTRGETKQCCVSRGCGTAARKEEREIESEKKTKRERAGREEEVTQNLSRGSTFYEKFILLNKHFI